MSKTRRILHPATTAGAVAVALALGFALALACPARAEHLEAQMYVVTDWTTVDCVGEDRGPWDDMVDAWYDEIADHGWFHKDRKIVNDLLSPQYLCDPDTQDGCFDYNYLDDGDAVMLGMHGGDSGNHWRGLTRFRGGHPDCYIDAPEAGSGDLLAGDVDTEFLHLSSCFSLDDDNLTNAWRMFQDPADSPGNGHRLHIATGFHGVMWIYSDWPHYYEDFADDAFDVSIKDAWMDNLYVNRTEEDSDQCPVAYAVGSSRNDCFNRIDNERYNNIFSDPTAINYYCYYYIKNCDPSSETAFDDPND